jgi:hypothetical protein
VARAGAPFCPDLQPGSDARSLLEQLPAALGAMAASAGTGLRMGADDMAQVLELGRRANQAAAGALAADAALFAATQALDAQQAHVRRARDALQSCMSKLAEGGGFAAPHVRAEIPVRS